MAALHDALKTLAPVEWSDVPLDDLEEYLKDAFAQGELIGNSVPQSDGTPFHAAEPHHDTPDLAKSAKDIHASEARQFAPHKNHEELQKGWGKPVKINAKDNPLNVSLYKMAGHDRRGAWFARRSVHEGLSFSKWKKALQREFPHSLSVQGGPGAGAVRGLAGDRRLERQAVDGVGKMEVYQLSAQFPGPVTPRDFLTLVATSDEALSDKSATALDNGSQHVPRHFMIVSRPCVHPDAPERAGYVRGQYESVEMIREIPLHHAQMTTKSTPNLLEHSEDHKARDQGATVAGDHADLKRPSSAGDEADPELNPVEWIMITRSDPGGGLPRFLVERGTPEAMLGDMSKFFNWACGMDVVPDPDDDSEAQQQTAEASAAESQTNGAGSDGQMSKSMPNLSQQRSNTEPLPASKQEQQQGGILSSLTTSLHAGLEAYAPAAVTNYLHPNASDAQLSDSSSETSVDSFLSAEELRRLSTAPEENGAIGSTDNLSTLSNAKTANGHSRNLSQHEKEIQKIALEREKLDRKLAKKREEEEEKLKKYAEKEQSEQEKAKERRDKELTKTEERHQKALEKLKQKEEKEIKKAEEKRRKKDDMNKLNLVTRERDEFRSQVDLTKRENELLMKQVEHLQAENTVLTSRLGKFAGEDALKSVREELSDAMSARKKADSIRSVESRQSGESSSRRS